MYKAKSPHTKTALETIKLVANKSDLAQLKQKTPPNELVDQLACFVSIHLIDGSLRGCIGTMEPREQNLYLEIISNAFSAATKDSRFEPVKVSELNEIEVSVDVLSKPWLIDDIEELDTKKYGVIVTDENYSRGVLLPDIEGIDSVDKQLSIAQRKAGLDGIDLSRLSIYAFTSKRYH